MHKAKGMVKDVFRTRNMRALPGQCGLGQVRMGPPAHSLAPALLSCATSTPAAFCDSGTLARHCPVSVIITSELAHLVPCVVFLQLGHTLLVGHEWQLARPNGLSTLRLATTGFTRRARSTALTLSQ
jgi:hypothetical protein